MKLICVIHGKKLVLDGEPMLFCGQSIWACPVKDCVIKVGVAELE